MAVNYYSDSLKYPEILNSVLERIRLYFTTLLYPDEDFSEAKKRFIRTDITTDFVLRENIEYFNITNAEFPFTAWSLELPEIDEEKFNVNMDNGYYYSSVFQCKFDVRPVVLEIPVVTFYNTGFDYFRAYTILQDEARRKIALDVPIIINNIEATLPIRLEMEISKGTYAFEFEQALATGRIKDIIHNVKVHYLDIINDVEVTEVEDIQVSLNSFSRSDYNDNVSVESSLMPTTPTLLSSTPENEEEDIPVTQNILLNFNVSMYEDSLIPALSITPFINYELTWNADSSSVIIDPVFDDLESGTEYTISISTSFKSAKRIPIEDDIEITFITEDI